jgi:hypothetical protein
MDANNLGDSEISDLSKCIHDILSELQNILENDCQ